MQSSLSSRTRYLRISDLRIQSLGQYVSRDVANCLLHAAAIRLVIMCYRIACGVGPIVDQGLAV